MMSAAEVCPCCGASSVGEPGIGSPTDESLPFFVYGALKHGEIAHHLILNLLARTPIPAVARGKLRIRDGLALFLPATTPSCRANSSNSQIPPLDSAL